MSASRMYPYKYDYVTYKGKKVNIIAHFLVLTANIDFLTPEEDFGKKSKRRVKF